MDLVNKLTPIPHGLPQKPISSIATEAYVWYLGKTSLFMFKRPDFTNFETFNFPSNSNFMPKMYVSASGARVVVLSSFRSAILVSDSLIRNIPIPDDSKEKIQCGAWFTEKDGSESFLFGTSDGILLRFDLSNPKSCDYLYRVPKQSPIDEISSLTTDSVLLLISCNGAISLFHSQYTLPEAISQGPLPMSLILGTSTRTLQQRIFPFKSRIYLLASYGILEVEFNSNLTFPQRLYNCDVNTCNIICPCDWGLFIAGSEGVTLRSGNGATVTIVIPDITSIHFDQETLLMVSLAHIIVFDVSFFRENLCAQILKNNDYAFALSLADGNLNYPPIYNFIKSDSSGKNLPF